VCLSQVEIIIFGARSWPFISRSIINFIERIIELKLSGTIVLHWKQHGVNYPFGAIFPPRRLSIFKHYVLVHKNSLRSRDLNIFKLPDMAFVPSHLSCEFLPVSKLVDVTYQTKWLPWVCFVWQLESNRIGNFQIQIKRGTSTLIWDTSLVRLTWRMDLLIS